MRRRERFAKRRALFRGQREAHKRGLRGRVDVFIGSGWEAHYVPTSEVLRYFEEWYLQLGDAYHESLGMVDTEQT